MPWRDRLSRSGYRRRVTHRCSTAGSADSRVMVQSYPRSGWDTSSAAPRRGSGVVDSRLRLNPRLCTGEISAHFVSCSTKDHPNLIRLEPHYRPKDERCPNSKLETAEAVEQLLRRLREFR